MLSNVESTFPILSLTRTTLSKAETTLSVLQHRAMSKQRCEYDHLQNIKKYAELKVSTTILSSASLYSPFQMKYGRGIFSKPQKKGFIVLQKRLFSITSLSLKLLKGRVLDSFKRFEQ